MIFLLESVAYHAKLKGVIVERVGRKYEAYREDDHSTVAEAHTLQAIWDDVQDLADTRVSAS